MIFETKQFYVESIIDADIHKIKSIYDSNIDFLLEHMDKTEVSLEWVIKEVIEMRKLGFNTCKIVEKNTNNIIGIIEFKVNEECYLSLLMLHNEYKQKRNGSSIYNELEKYLKLEGCKYIKIDVVKNYNLLRFWETKGFKRHKEVKLNWTGKALSATTMIKSL